MMRKIPLLIGIFILGGLIAALPVSGVDADAAENDMSVTIQTEVALSLDRSDPTNPVFTGKGDIYATTLDAYSRKYVGVTLPDYYTLRTPVGEKSAPEGTRIVFDGSLNARNGYENYRAVNGLDGKSRADLYLGKVEVTVPFTKDFVDYGIGTYSFDIPVTLEADADYGIYSENLYFTPWKQLIAEQEITISENVLTNIAKDGMILDIDPSVVGITALLKGMSYREIYFPASVVSTSDTQPLNDSNVEKVVFADGTEKVPEYICLGAGKLITVELPETVRILGKSSFLGCRKLTFDGINLPHDITFDEGCFAYCKNLKELHFRDGMKTTIPNTHVGPCIGPFLGSGIEKVIIEDGVDAVPADLCFECREIKEISFPQSDIEIGNYAFSWLPNLKEITIRSNITRPYSDDINDIQKCFENTGIETIYFEEGVTSIPSRLIDTDSADLKKIYIPASVTHIDEHAFTFGYAQGNFTVYFGGTEAEWNQLMYNPQSNWPKVRVAKVVCSDTVEMTTEEVISDE